ncbi:MAG: NAD(P)H-dependent flavin oxidoreductase [Sciscionella sp.]
MLPGMTVPVVLAPMAGGVGTPALIAAVAESGGLATLPAGYLDVETFGKQLAEVRAATDRPFAVNLFVPGPESTVDTLSYVASIAADAVEHGVELGAPAFDDDDYPAKLELVIAERVPVVSFTFGLPGPTEVARLHAAGSTVVATVTTPREAHAAVRVGADVLCLQGVEAGGHRGCFDVDEVEGFSLLPLIGLVARDIGLPLIAAGGIMRRADVAAVLAAGASAAQCGTAFLRCPEAGTGQAHREALAAGRRRTVITKAFTGRPARGLNNRFAAEHSAGAPSAYPQLHHVTKPLRAAAAAVGDTETVSLWAGQGYPLGTANPAAEVLAALNPGE